MTQELLLTGERTVPGVALENYWFRRHEAAYQWVIDSFNLAGALVVEAGCGEGYGAAALCGAGANVLAVDDDPATAEHANVHYPQVRVAQANLVQLPLPDASVGFIVSMQVIEHLWDVRAFLRECHRVLAPAGTLIVSTPNRITFSPDLGRHEPPVNPFHREEFDAGQLRDLVSGEGFDVTAIAGLQHGPRLLAAERASGSLVQRQIDAILSGDTWPTLLKQEVAQVTSGDFTIGPVIPEEALDLIVTARRRSP
ncbi:MAG: class I SAM-dependent methyltransferase [Candidatus Nanopelagicales bacterium]|nr:class I SAM-dependent methyltransferase [Candidatus Nanopelagicales bacterium]MDZ4250163.1 class I SAM-dependent methyltransferase [Candidatus Nanopelagicales bacterium]